MLQPFSGFFLRFWKQKDVLFNPWYWATGYIYFPLLLLFWLCFGHFPPMGVSIIPSSFPAPLCPPSFTFCSRSVPGSEAWDSRGSSSRPHYPWFKLTHWMWGFFYIYIRNPVCHGRMERGLGCETAKKRIHICSGSSVIGLRSVV